MAEYTREVHEEYAIARWPETKRLLGLLVNSSGAAHARNARRIVHAARKQDRRLSAALLAAALAHTPEAQQALDGARQRMARKPSALARELLRNFPKGKGKRGRRKRNKGGGGQNGGNGGQNGESGAAATKAKSGTGGSGRSRRRGGAKAKAAQSQNGPAEAVIDEALAVDTKAIDDPETGEMKLDESEREEIEENVVEAIDHALASLGSSGGGRDDDEPAPVAVPELEDEDFEPAPDSDD
jgi:hypothetical protein